jgi:hypothetical protein
LGFSDAEALEEAQWFASLPRAERERIRAEAQRQDSELPDHESRDPERRRNRVQEQATDAPERITDERVRSVSVGREAVKEDTEPYLREQYTKDGVMICQVCKSALPFTLDDGSYYFEMVEFLRELKKRHYQNYLALCPDHAAMFKYANGSRDVTKALFLRMDGQELEVILAREAETIYFTKTHIADLRAVIEADGKQGLEG